MKTLRVDRVVVAVFFVLLIPLAGGSDPAFSVEVDATAAPKTVRADEMSAWSVDSGGGESSGGDFTLTAAIGQSDTGLISQCGTVFDGGLWAGAVDLQPVFCNGFESGDTALWSEVVGGTE